MKVDGISLAAGATMLLIINVLLLLVRDVVTRAMVSALAGWYVSHALNVLGKPVFRR